jgi:hypothetical protein
MIECKVSSVPSFKGSHFSIKSYLHDAVVSIGQSGIRSGKGGGGLRAPIKKLSDRSKRRLRLLLRNSTVEWRGMITLTYGSVIPESGLESKKHLNSFLQKLRRQKTQYCWALEFQERGAPHYHILVDAWVKKTEVGETWARIIGQEVESTATRVESIRQRHGACGYLMGYMSKEAQKRVPSSLIDVGRFWGCTTGLLKTISELYLKNGEKEGRKVFRVMRKYYEAKCKVWGFKWRWRLHRGFICWGGSSVYSKVLEGAKFEGVPE